MSILKKKVILDCDTGSDDACAIMLAVLADEIDLLGICTTAGNKEVSYTTENTLAVLEALGSQVPVYAGSNEPLVARLLRGRHGNYDGMGRCGENRVNEKGQVISFHSDHLPLPYATRKAEDMPAVLYLIDTLMHSDGDITIVETAPMTNLALAMKVEPRVTSKIKEIVFMGGGVLLANATPCAEFNFWTDPEAAQIVLKSGIPLTMVPLDATHQTNFTLEDAERFRQIGSVVTAALAEMLTLRIQAFDLYQPQDEMHSCPLHDALAMAYLIDPQVLTDLRSCHVEVDFGGGIADGATILDRRAEPDAANCVVAMGADRERFQELTFQMLERTRGDV